MHLARIEAEASTQPRGPRPLLRSAARSAFRFALAAAASAALVGCGNTYRPVVTAINPVGPAGQPPKYAVAISTTGPSTPGLATFVDFSGDTVLITASIGVNPYYLVLDATGTTGYTLNHDSTLTSFDISPALLSSEVNQTTLLSGAAPVSIFPEGTYTYVADPGRGVIGDFQKSPPVLLQEFPVLNPIYVVGVAGAPRSYALGQDGSTGQATPLEVASNSPDSPPLTVGSNPVYGVMTANGKRAFILNQGDGTVSVINAQTNQLDTFQNSDGTINHGSIPVGSHPLWADFAPTRNELIVANAGADNKSPGSVSIISIPLCSATSLPTNPNCDPNNPVDAAGFGTVLATVPVGVNPVMVSVLQDGTRAYVANTGDPSLPCAAVPVPGQSTSCSVSVINLTTNTVSATVNGLADSACLTAKPGVLCGHPTYLVATVGTPTGKVYVTSSDSTNMSIIRTDTDSISTIVPLQGKGVAVRITAP